MMKVKLQNWIGAIVFVTLLGGSLLTTSIAPQASAGVISGNPSCAGSFLTLPVWYRGLTISDTDCTIKNPADAGGLSSFIWHIVLNGIDIALQVVGYLSAFFIIYGGYLYLTSSGDASGVAKAKTTLTNAIIGLVLSMASVGLINLVFGIIK